DIPEGEYGAGHVDVWDHGTYAAEKWRDDEVIVTLHGAPDGGLGGVPARVALIRTDRDDGKDWLLHRMEPAGPTRRDWLPMLATLGDADRPPTGPDLAIEPKWDGYRALAFVHDGETELRTRNGLDTTAAYPELPAPIAAAVAGRDAVLDGEIVAFDDRGRPDFGLLQQRARLRRPSEIAQAVRDAPVHFVAFDLLELDGEDLARLPYRERRVRLEAAVRDAAPVLRSPLLEGTVGEALDRVRELGIEGVVVKDPEARYTPGRRTRAWIKLKLHRTQEVVIAGWRPGRGSRGGGIGSLLLGIPEEGGLRYVGRVGTGFDERALAELGRLTRPLARRTSPLVGVPAADARDAHWVTPRLVGEVEYAERTRDGRLRQPTWRGLRRDKAVADVRTE
ncbi:MAG: non-homologous end-joining DNA ligase, partial [Microbacteriaceae bacterium]|nr:non-homologous end-joining DNA ligase [Microbacteriaceae bacterium]